MDGIIIWVHVLINALLLPPSIWIIVSPVQPRTLRVIAATICAVGVANLVGMAWFDYGNIWPGEIATNLSAAALLYWLAWRAASVESPLAVERKTPARPEASTNSRARRETGRRAPFPSAT